MHYCYKILELVLTYEIESEDTSVHNMYQNRSLGSFDKLKRFILHEKYKR